MTRAVTIIAFPTAAQSDNRTRPKFLPADPPDVKVGKLGNWGTTHSTLHVLTSQLRQMASVSLSLGGPDLSVV